MTPLVLAWHARILPRPTASRRETILPRRQESGRAPRLCVSENRASTQGFHRLCIFSRPAERLLQAILEEGLDFLALGVVAQDRSRADQRSPTLASRQPGGESIEMGTHEVVRQGPGDGRFGG